MFKIMLRLMRSLPDFRGKQRLVRLFWWKHLSKLQNVIINGKYGIKYKVPNCIETIGFEILINGIYEKETSDLIRNRIPHNGVYFDIGANIGSISIPVCKQRPDIKTICIEASTEIFKYLEFNFKLNNLDKPLLLRTAISDREGEIINFSVPEERFGGGHQSINNENVSEKVSTSTVDQIIKDLSVQKVDLIKIDIEGYEYYAFKGASNLLMADNAPDIIFEFIDCAEESVENLKAGDAQKLLIEFGYRLFEMKNKPVLLNSPLLKGSAMLLATKK